MKKDFASVILVTWAPTEERMKFLKQTLFSFYTFTNYPYELIVVDNGPAEQTEFLKTQEIDKHIVNKKNMPLGHCRDLGFKHAKGEYIAYIENDFVFKPNWLTACIRGLIKNKKKKLFAVGIWSGHQSKNKKRFVDKCVGGSLWIRGSIGNLIGRKKDFDKVMPPPSHKARFGDEYCKKILRSGYLIFVPHGELVIHMGRHRASYNWRNVLENGAWRKKKKGERAVDFYEKNKCNYTILQ